MKGLNLRGHHKSRSGFSLVEVIVSLAVVTFALLPVLGLVGVGLNSVQDSDMKVQAANVALAILNKRITAPAAVNASQTPFSPLPTIDSASVTAATFPTTTPAATTTFIGSGGEVVTSASAAKFTLNYRVWRDTSSVTNVTAGTTPNVKLVRIDLVLSWPPNAPVNVHNQYELLTSTLVSP